MSKQTICLTLILTIVLMGCQSAVSTPSLTPAATHIQPTSPIDSSPPEQEPSATVEPQQTTPSAPLFTTPALTTTTQLLSPITIDWTKPFAGETDTGENIVLTSWSRQPYSGKDLLLPFSLDQIENTAVLDGLTAAQKTFLAQNGFVVLHSQEAQFGDIRVETASRSGQPYYLTTDAAYHALHLLFDDLLKSLESEYFRPQMIAITKATLEQVRSEAPEAQGTSIEADVGQAIAYLSVALKLFDPTAQIDPSVESIVSRQVEQILAADGRAKSALFPDFEDDYGAYKPVGHYAGDPDLEAYFRGMTWYGRMHFLLKDPTNPKFIASRLPLIVTLALRRGQVDNLPAAEAWVGLHRTLDFMIGPSDDAGPLEYAELMDQVYGNNPKIQDLAEQSLWDEFLARSDQLPAPRINSLFIDSTKDLSSTKGWRFMGQRFTLDSMIFQNVIFDRVEKKADNTRRELPSGLDVMAAFGSSPAFHELDKHGVTGFPNYTDQMQKMQQLVLAQPVEQWLGRFYDGWLYSFLPAVQAKQPVYPAYMQTSAWSYKDLNAALGSWAELKHDTVLYTKMPEMAGGGGPPMSDPAPSYVEPNPDVFYRMAYIARTLSCGLQNLMLYGPFFLNQSTNISAPDVSGYIMNMGALGSTFETFGDIAVKELAGQALDEDENYAITRCLGMIECMNIESDYSHPNSEMPKVPVIAAVSGADDSILEVGIGNVDRIYVAVPLEDKWEVAQGGVFSYYEFSQPRDQRLNDDEWRKKLASGEVEMPGWASNFVLEGGQPKEVLFFRVGDVYVITQAGNKLNVRAQPSTSSAVISQLKTGDYAEIVDGPALAEGYTWWKFKSFDWSGGAQTEGWAVEDQQWYGRSYLP